MNEPAPDTPEGPQDNTSLPQGKSPALIDADPRAPIPLQYGAAMLSIQLCEKLDECSTWKNKAAALASYARQARDEDLVMVARRIQARAVRRCGELLQEFDARGGDQRNNPTEESETEIVGNHNFAPTRTEAARDAGLSPHQQRQAMNMANIPPQEFETMIEAKTPPTVTSLADYGKKARDKPSPPADPNQELAAEVGLILDRLNSYQGQAEAIALGSREDLAFRDEITAAQDLLDAITKNLRGTS